MDDSLLNYYEGELRILRQLGQEFAQAYPKVANRLLLEPDNCEDPHVERLIQAVALLAARIHHKLDDEFPEIVNALLGLLYPQYVAPIPSMSIVQFVLDPEQGKLTSGYPIASGTELFSIAVEGSQCRFRTCYPVTLWPLQVTAAKFDVPDRVANDVKARGLIRLNLRCQGGITFRELDIDRLRVYLDGEGQIVHALYELLLNNAQQVWIRPSSQNLRRPFQPFTGCSLHPVGYDSHEEVIPYPRHALSGYRLIQEYFAFPQKFLFVDLKNFRTSSMPESTDALEVLIFLDKSPRPDHILAPENFRLGCTPIINLFRQPASPIRLDQTQHEYRIIPDIRRQHANEVYAVDEVVIINPHSNSVERVDPLYSLGHGGAEQKASAYWYARRQQSDKHNDEGSEVYLSLVNLQLNPSVPAAETMAISVTCTNRGLAAKLSADDVRGEFEMESAAPVSRIRALVKPTNPIRPPLSGERQWQLISQLSLNYLSLTGSGPEALREILTLYDFSDSPVTRQHIAGITNIISRRVVRRPAAMGWHGFCRGTEVTLEFDEDKYVGSGVFLFASVLEQFFALYATMNSFTQLVAKSHQRERPIKQWPPRTGEQVLL